MDQQSREELNRIIELGSDSLTPEDVNFLYARRSYLNKTQREEFKKVIHDKDEQVKAASTAVEE